MTSRDLKPLLPGLHRISSVAALKVLMVLAAHANRSGACWLSWATIARLSGLSRRAVADGLRRLEQVGLVRRVGPAPRGRGTTFQLGPADGEPRCTRCTAVHQGGECSRTGVVHAGAPMAEVHAGAPSEGRNPLRTGVSAQDPAQGGGACLCSIEGEGENIEGVTKGKPSASGPPAFNGASGPEAFGLDEPEALFEQLLEEVLNRVPFDPNLGGWMIGTHDLIRVRNYIEDKFPELLEVFRRVARSRMGDRGFDEAWRAAVTNGVGSCAAWHSGDRRWRRIYLFVGETLGLFNAVVEACYALFSPPDGGGPGRQALQAAEALHEVAR